MCKNGPGHSQKCMRVLRSSEVLLNGELKEERLNPRFHLRNTEISVRMCVENGRV